MSGFGVFLCRFFLKDCGFCWLFGVFGVCEIETVFHESLVYEIMLSNTNSNCLLNVNAIK